MSDSFLTNRELALFVALLFWLAVAALWSRRGASGGALGGLARGPLSAILNKAILVPVVVYLCWVSAAFIAADAVGLWDVQLVTAAVMWLLFSGLGLFGTGVEAIKKDGEIARAFRRLLGVSLIFEFVANAASFSLFIEIPAQILAVPCGVVSALGSARREHRAAGMLASGYFALLGVAALGWGITRLVADWKVIDKSLFWRELVMPLWLTPVALAFMTLLALYFVYEATFSAMASESAVGLSWRHRLAVLARCGPRLRAVRAVRPAASWLANDPGFRSTWRWTGRILREDRKRRANETAQAQRLVNNAGAVGTDSSGRQLDQREHAETRKALQWLYTCHLGYYPKQGNRYFEGLEIIIDGLSEKYCLPNPNNIEMHISDDGQSWYATRQTITGHWFAIGAAGPPTDQWFYDGPTAATSFPHESEWDQWVPGSNSPNWAETPETPLDDTTEVGDAASLCDSDTRSWRRFVAAFRRLTTKTKTDESDRPPWCSHYDEWKRSYDETEALMARNSIRTEDWSRDDLARLAELTRTYGEAAGRMWDEAPESENWTSAHIKCARSSR